MQTLVLHSYRLCSHGKYGCIVDIQISCLFFWSWWWWIYKPLINQIIKLSENLYKSVSFFFHFLFSMFKLMIYCENYQQHSCKYQWYLCKLLHIFLYESKRQILADCMNVPESMCWLYRWLCLAAEFMTSNWKYYICM